MSKLHFTKDSRFIILSTHYTKQAQVGLPNLYRVLLDTWTGVNYFFDTHTLIYGSDGKMLVSSPEEIKEAIIRHEERRN